MSKEGGQARRKVVVEASTGGRALEQSRLRLMCVALFFFLCFASISVKLVEMMIVSVKNMPDMMSRQSALSLDPEEQEVVVPEPRLKRGDITDRNGVVLATSLMTASAFANPREITNPQEAAQKLEKAVGIGKDVLLKRLTGKKSFVWIKRQITPREQQAVNDLGIPGVYFLPEEQRVYPYGNTASHTVGYVGIDNRGLAGIEKQFDRELMDEQLSRTPLALSIDIRVQHIMRDELKRAVDEFSAIGATGIVLDIPTGEVVSMVSLPDFDPHRPAKAKDEQKFNRASLGAYEMGSTFKSFTMALALENGVSLRDGYDATNPLKLANFTISDSHPKKRWLSLPEIFAYSSNIGTAKALLDVGIKRQKKFMDELGMLEPVEIELPERASPLYPREWRELSAVTISYGHGISVSPLHLVRGMAAILDGGKMERLTLLKDGNKDKAEGERVVSEKTARQMADLLRLVVKHGTGSKANVPGYQVGGKTGTAEKIKAGGAYSRNTNMSSFIATFPVDSPRYVVLVMIDEPKGTKQTYGYATGGWTAAPAAGRVIARMAPLLGIAPKFEEPTSEAEKYWVQNEKNGVARQVAAPRPMMRQYLHAVAY